MVAFCLPQKIQLMQLWVPKNTTDPHHLMILIHGKKGHTSNSPCNQSLGLEFWSHGLRKKTHGTKGDTVVI